MILDLDLFINALLSYLGFSLILHLLVINLMFSKGFFETTSRHLIDKVALVLQGLLDCGKFL